MGLLVTDAVGHRPTRRWPYFVAAAEVVLMVVLLTSESFTDLGGFWLITWVASLGVGTVIFSQAPGNVVGTLLFASGTLSMASNSVTPTAKLVVGDGHGFLAWTEAYGMALNTFVVPLMFLLLLRFPDGRLAGPRWRPVERAGIGVLMIGSAAAFINGGWGGDEAQARVGFVAPLRDRYGALADTLSALFFPGMLVIVVAGLVSVVVHYRRGSAKVRTQIRWLIFAAGILAVQMAFFNSPLIPTSGGSTHWSAAVTGAAISFIPISMGIAIVRHQLFDIDVVISRTLVYASTLAVIAGVYVAIVFGVGSLIGQASDDSPVLPVVATALIAVVFHPARTRLERLANRIVFGRRATPYEVLSSFTQRVAATDGRLLDDVARSVTEGTVASGASVWSFHDEVLEPVSVWPDRNGDSTSYSGVTSALYGEDGGLIVPGAERTYPITHDGDVLGALGLSLPKGETLSPSDEALVAELRAGIGLALWNRSLTDELRAVVDELRASRRRLVAVQDQTRHRLERDLHDGAQQRLVAVKVRLSLARQMADKAGALVTAEALGHLCNEADEAIESLRAFARGVYPPLLEAEGLRPALEAQITRSFADATIECTVEGRYPRAVESTVYFCVLQILADAGWGAAAASGDGVVITVDEERGTAGGVDALLFAVRRPEIAGSAGDGVPINVHDRVGALDGRLDVDRESGSIAVRGRVPVRPTVTDGSAEVEPHRNAEPMPV